MGNLIYDIFCPCCNTKPTYNHDTQRVYHEQHPLIKEDELIQPLNANQANEYRSLNTVDPNLFSNLEDLRLKPSNFVRLNNQHPSEVYKQIEEIGEGSYGSIIKVKHRLTGEIRAMKIIQKRRMAYGINENKILEEIKILKSLDHPNIIKLYEFFVDKLNFYIVMEYSDNGDLYSFLCKNRYLKESVVCSVIKQIMSAVAYLHSKNIIHGDIKLENILIDTIHRDARDVSSGEQENLKRKVSNSENNINNSKSVDNVTIQENVVNTNDKVESERNWGEQDKFIIEKDSKKVKPQKGFTTSIYSCDDTEQPLQTLNLNTTNRSTNYSSQSESNSKISNETLFNYTTITNIEVKIIDFGCSKFFLPNEVKSEIVGTAFYVAPEVLNQEYNNKCDLWSVGVIMYTLLIGKPPFVGRTQSEILGKVAKGEYDLNTKRFEKVSKESKDLLVQLLRYNYKTRPSAYQALGHVWFKSEEWKKSNISRDFEFDMLFETYKKLKAFKVKNKFEQAVLTILVHNSGESLQYKKLRKMFLMFDYDSDGRISPGDLGHLIDYIQSRKGLEIIENIEKNEQTLKSQPMETELLEKMEMMELLEKNEKIKLMEKVNCLDKDFGLIKNEKTEKERKNVGKIGNNSEIGKTETLENIIESCSVMSTNEEKGNLNNIKSDIDPYKEDKNVNNLNVEKKKTLTLHGNSENPCTVSSNTTPNSNNIIHNNYNNENNSEIKESLKINDHDSSSIESEENKIVNNKSKITNNNDQTNTTKATSTPKNASKIKKKLSKITKQIQSQQSILPANTQTPKQDQLSEVSLIMKNVDYDKNGFIEFEEFLKSTLDKSILLSEKNLKQAFEIFFLGEKIETYKANKEKVITSREIERTIFSGCSAEIKEKFTINIMEELGKTITDCITFEEFKKIMGISE